MSQPRTNIFGEKTGPHQKSETTIIAHISVSEQGNVSVFFEFYEKNQKTIIKDTECRRKEGKSAGIPLNAILNTLYTIRDKNVVSRRFFINFLDVRRLRLYNT